MRLPVSGTKARYFLDLGLLGRLNRMISSGIFRPPLDSRTLRSIRATKWDYGLVFVNTARRKVILQPQKALEGPASRRLDKKENDKSVMPKAKRNTAARAFMNGKKVKVEVQKDVIPVTLGKAFEKVPTFDLQANVNTLMFINGVVLLEKGLWELWDLAYGDGLISNICSITLGLTIIAITRIFNLPLAEWKRRPDDDD